MCPLEDYYSSQYKSSFRVTALLSSTIYSAFKANCSRLNSQYSVDQHWHLLIKIKKPPILQKDASPEYRAQTGRKQTMEEIVVLGWWSEFIELDLSKQKLWSIKQHLDCAALIRCSSASAIAYTKAVSEWIWIFTSQHVFCDHSRGDVLQIIP